MPNLEHDPQNPSDLLGQPIAEGDIVAWGTTYGRSPALCVARIEKIRFIRKSGSWNGWNGNKEVPQAHADDYTLSLRPLKSTGDVAWVHKGTGEPWYVFRDGPIDLARVEAKLKSVKHVKNIVKLNPDVIDAGVFA